MFKITDNAITPRKAHFDDVIRRLPGAHRVAHEHFVAHIHGAAQNAAKKAGLDHEAVVVDYHRGMPYVGIQQSASGDHVADVEYGLPGIAPNPVLRTAVRAAHKEANRRYVAVLRGGIGL